MLPRLHQVSLRFHPHALVQGQCLGSSVTLKPQHGVLYRTGSSFKQIDAESVGIIIIIIISTNLVTATLLKKAIRNTDTPPASPHECK